MLVEASGDLEPRITLTGPVLKSAKQVHVLITGDEKRAALANAKGQTPEVAPIALVLDRANIHWAL
jgi:6-phosphogluconolactonase